MREKPRDINSARNAKDGAAPRGLTRHRLAAILAGDIAGLSRLLDLDKEGTHARVKRIQRDLIEPSIAAHHGRLVKATGDGFIAIFDSPVKAVRCGIVIQQDISGRNTSLPRDQRIQYRIGINLGDVTIEEDDIYGDGVDVEYCLESIADPGEVCVSGDIYEQVKHKLACRYELLDDHNVQNIAVPARVYRVLADPTAFDKATRSRENAKIFFPSFLQSSVLLVIVGGAVWYILQQPYGNAPRQDPNTASSAVAGGNQLPESPQPPPSAAPAPQVAAQAQPPPSATPAPQATASQAQPPPSAAPAAEGAAAQAQGAASAGTNQAASQGALAPQTASAVREPEMNLLRGGTFLMGSNDDDTEKPIHRVTLKPFAISRYPISVREWNECAAAKACGFVASGKDDAPVTNVSWSDANQFVTWLAGATGKPYRLPSEAEWEFAARGGTQTRYWWGDQFQPDMANCKNCTDVAAAEQPAKIGSFKPNPFGLYDMGGSVDQWVEDCWHRAYRGAPSDGSPWIEGDCPSHVIRSGSWENDSSYVRPANRDSYDTNVRYPTHGFRVALSTSVPPRMTNPSSSPLAGGNQLSGSRQPPPSAAPAAQAAASQAQGAASAGTKQAALPGALESQTASVVREPEMNMLRGDTFMMGSNDDATEKPIHHVTLKPFAISRYPISVREWNECAAAKACGFVASGKDDAPVTNVSWSDAKQFVTWLAGATGKPYRLPSEAEWEFAARGGTQTRYWWGDKFQPGMANCKNCTDVAAAEQPVGVGSFKPNPFGLYDMGGGVNQWVEDCWHGNYHGAPSDGSPWIAGNCPSHVIRSGSWKNDSRYVRPANRDSYNTNVRYPTHGFRVALSP